MTQNPEPAEERKSGKKWVWETVLGLDFEYILNNNPLMWKSRSISVYVVFILVSGGENKESFGFWHGGGFLLQLNVGEWTWTRTYWHLWLLIVLHSCWKEQTSEKFWDLHQTRHPSTVPHTSLHYSKKVKMTQTGNCVELGGNQQE